MRQEKIRKMPFNKVVDRRLKVFWVIQKLQHNYFKNKKRYSLRNVVMMVNSILEKKGFKKVTKRTIQSDIKNFEEMGLLKVDFNPLGKNNGSFTYYIINKTLEKIANKAISKAYFIKRKKNIDQTINNTITKDKLKEQNQQFKISHQIFSHLLGETKSKYYKYKNSNQKEFKKREKHLEKIILQKFRRVKKEDLNEIQDIVKTQLSYKNTLWNFKDFMEELREYDEKDAINFFKIILRKKRNKIWFMSKRSKKTDFNMIIGEFKDKNKTKLQILSKGQTEMWKPKMNYIDNPNGIVRTNELISNIMSIQLRTSN
ncbi:plasmid maintenance protein (plasmid) [Borrelia miyamotoi]|uniref:Plasmid maintenance protein n=2 Tax=Borrelia miyamotoi TaxID=47466 RepID=A0AAQ3HFW1_9SPIR|nr:plasmid maintenance protein [Borrelia miyamotoi]ATQ15389.1 plasmid maintenance protein [Borrelia miyamotoi]ATQ16560.1 plasmid maintenance protein [Borrelia miyamotoi]ATQ17700.1 plasmid maintenance protein [Borrelia miyamotoi]ATQ18950.1 plasmid maintenance protein [Borrelia miyamotoi]ATQ20198.1 plasmid maintenance protein [Borrelia miyamotoi]